MHHFGRASSSSASATRVLGKGWLRGDFAIHLSAARQRWESAKFLEEWSFFLFDTGRGRNISCPTIASQFTEFSAIFTREKGGAGIVGRHGNHTQCVVTDLKAAACARSCTVTPLALLKGRDRMVITMMSLMKSMKLVHIHEITCTDEGAEPHNVRRGFVRPVTNY